MQESRAPTRSGPFFTLLRIVWALSIAGAGVAHAAELPDETRLAYLDPGTGSLIIQAVLAALAAVAVTTRIYWTKVKGWFGFAAANQPDDGDLAPEVSPESPPKDV